MTAIAQNTQIPPCKDLINNLLNYLSEKERGVIKSRFALDSQKKETLDQIGKKLSVTRERVRQVEAVAIKKLARVSVDPEIKKIHAIAFRILQEHGGVASEEVIVSEMLKEMKQNTPKDSNAIKLAIRISDQFTKQEKNQFYKAFWRLSHITLPEVKVLIKNIQKTLQKEKNLLSLQQLSMALDADEEKTLQVQSVLNIDWSFCEIEEKWGLSQWRHINPRSIKDRILIIFKKKGAPMHFSEVADEVLEAFANKKSVTRQAVHNELIRHPEFVLVGRGVYGLQEWGMVSGTVCDVIKAILIENGGPMKRQNIIEAVLERRDIQVGTISLNLQKYEFFHRVGRAVYEYKPELDDRKERKYGTGE